MAAGLTVNKHKLDEFIAAFDQAAMELLPPDFLEERIETDGVLLPGLLNEGELTPVMQAVWGQGFPPPSFIGEFEVSSQTVLKGAHSKLDVTIGGHCLKAMWFNHSEPVPEMLRAVYRPVLNTFRGNTSVEVILDRVLDVEV